MRHAKWFVIPGVAVMLVVVVLLFFMEQVDATQECAVTVGGGKEAGVVGPGWHFTPPGTSFHCYTVTQKTMELVAGDPAQSNSKADYVDWAIRARSLDGIDQYAMLTMQFHTDRSAIEGLYPTYPSDEAVKEQLVKSRLRAVVPQVLSLSNADAQYKGNIGPISDQIETELKRQLEPFGIKVDYFELKRSDFDDRYEEAIRARATEVEAAEKKRLEQQTALAEAERQRIQAEGDQAAAQIAADAAAYVTVTNANAEAEAEVAVLKARAAQLQENPELLEWERVQSIRDAGAVYLPSGTLPLFDIPAPEE